MSHRQLIDAVRVQDKLTRALQQSCRRDPRPRSATLSFIGDEEWLHDGLECRKIHAMQSAETSDQLQIRPTLLVAENDTMAPFLYVSIEQRHVVYQVLRRDAAKTRAGMPVIRPAQLLHARARNDDTTDEVKCPAELEEWLQIPFEHLDLEHGVSRVIRAPSLREHGARDVAEIWSRLDASLLVNVASRSGLADETAEVDVVEDESELI